MSSLFQKSSKKRPRPAPPAAAIEGDGGGPSPPPTTNSLTTTFADLGLCAPLASTCRKLGFVRPTAVQRAIVPLVLDPGAKGGHHHILTLSATGSGKTAAFALPLLHLLSRDPYGIYALILTPTRELAKQIQQQVLALGNGSGWRITCALIIGGEDATRQSLELSQQPNFVVGTPGRTAELCRDGAGGGLYRPNFRKVRFVVLDEADRLLSARSGFERDVAECLLQSTTTVGRDGGKRTRRDVCRTLLFSATMTRSLSSLEEMAGAGAGRLPLKKVVVREDGSWDDGEVEKEQAKKRRRGKKTSSDVGEMCAIEDDGNDCDDKDDDSEDSSSELESTPNIPAGLRQEYIFMPSRVREAYLLCAIRTLMTHGGRRKFKKNANNGSGWNNTNGKNVDLADVFGDDNDDHEESGGNRKKRTHPLAQSAIIFVPTCERCAHVSGILTELGIGNVALHSLLSQNRRLASLGAFQSQRVRVLVATDVASRGLDVPEVDLVINMELPRRAVDYVHRVGRTARAGRRGHAVSLVGERDVDLVHEAERISGRKLEKCEAVTDEMGVRLLGPVAKASRLAKMKLMDIGFDELVQKHRERKRRDRRRREKAERRARRAAAKAMGA